MHVPGDRLKNNLFGEIAVEMNFVDPLKVEKALVVQQRIFESTRVSMPIGEILVEMGAITIEVRDQILQMQSEVDSRAAAAPAAEAPRQRIPSNAARKTTEGLNLTVSKDKLTVSAYIEGKVPITDMTVDDVKIMLHSEGILYGIAEDERIAAFLNGELCAGESWTIAAGSDPIPDAPPEFIYHFDTDPLKVGTLTEAGLMDWKERGTLPQVKEGDLLAEKIPGAKGKEGMDVFGKKIPVPKAREQRFKCGKGARRSEDGLLVHASLAGIPKLSIGGELSVMPILTVDGDISLQTGHVEFEGHIEVSGAVEKGYRVRGGSLRASEIRDAQIDIAGDISATNGIFGATIRCCGNLKVGHIHNADIIVAGDITVEKEIIESKIEANGRCLINDGIIIASKISARMGVSVMDIGTGASKTSHLTVGVDQHLEREAATIRAEIQAIKSARESLPNLLDNLKKRSDQVNTRLGQVAQEQDRCMVQHRRLQEKVEAGLLAKGGAAAEKLQKTILELKAKQDAYDHDVTELMEEDETLVKEIGATEKELTESAVKIKEFNARLEEITEEQKEGRGLASVKIGGKVYAGTEFTGPHSVLVLQEDLMRLTVAETDKPDHEGIKRWRFDLNPFR